MRRIILLALAGLLLLPAVVLADGPRGGLLLSSDQLWLVLISAFIPLVTYVINHVGPWVSEPIKAGVLVIAAAVAGGVYKAVQDGNFGWNAPTAEYVLTAVVAALGAHNWLWRPSGVNAVLGAGTNRAPAR